MNTVVNDIFIKTIRTYEYILREFYPSHESKGFTERNLTFNFSHNYLKNYNNSIIWQEIPLKSAGFIDTLIIDDLNKCIIFIEAKRLQNQRKLDSINDDYLRIIEKHDEIAEIPNRQHYSKFILLFIDVWISKESREVDVRKKMHDKFLSYSDDNIVCFNTKEVVIENFNCKETYHLSYRLHKLV